MFHGLAAGRLSSRLALLLSRTPDDSAANLGRSVDMTARPLHFSAIIVYFYFDGYFPLTGCDDDYAIDGQTKMTRRPPRRLGFMRMSTTRGLTPTWKSSTTPGSVDGVKHFAAMGAAMMNGQRRAAVSCRKILLALRFTRLGLAAPQDT